MGQSHIMTRLHLATRESRQHLLVRILGHDGTCNAHGAYSREVKSQVRSSYGVTYCLDVQVDAGR